MFEKKGVGWEGECQSFSSGFIVSLPSLLAPSPSPINTLEEAAYVGLSRLARFPFCPEAILEELLPIQNPVSIFHLLYGTLALSLYAFGFFDTTLTCF